VYNTMYDDTLFRSSITIVHENFVRSVD